MRINFKKTNGITLIALVITIIVLLILANATISLLIGDSGILNQATKSRDQYEEANYKEKIYLAKGNAIIALKRDITIDEWIERIYKENIVPKGSITKTSEHSAEVATPEGYIIYLHDGKSDKPVNPDEPVIVLGDDEIIIDGTEMPVLGDINSDLEKPGNEWGKSYTKGVVFKYNDEYYIVKYNQYMTKDNVEQMVASRNGLIKLNPEKGFVTPSESTVEGDLKLQDGKVYAYGPYGDTPDGYLYNDWWIEVIAS